MNLDGLQILIEGFGQTRKLSSGLELGKGAGIWLEGRMVRIGGDERTAVWVKRANGVSGWLHKYGAERVYASGVESGDVVVIGDGQFWQTVDVGKKFWDGQESYGGNGGWVVIQESIKLEKIEAPMQAKFEANKVSLKEKLGKWKLKLPSRTAAPVFVVHGQDEEINGPKQKRLIWIGVGTLVILGLLVGVGRIKRQQVIKATSVQNQTIETVVSQYREAKAIVGMNPERSKQLVATIQTSIQSLDGEYAKDTRLDEVKQGIGEVLGIATGSHVLGGTVLVDTALLREGMEVQKLALDVDTLWALDEKAGRVVAIVARTGAADVKYGQTEFGSPSQLAAYPGMIFVLSNKGIVKCGTGVSPSGCQTVVAADGEWGKIEQMVAWAGNIYLLDSGKQTIWKYPVIEAGYGAKQTWANSEDAGGVMQSSMTIDGNVWVMGADGTLIKFTAGTGETITLSGHEGSFGAEAKIYTTDDMTGIYVLDKQNGRIIEFSKAGGYLGQWTDEHLKQASDVVVSEASRKVWWTTGREVWEGNL